MINIIISPSGKFYGSEQVLFDYLSNSRNKFVVYIRGKDILYKTLKALKRHEVRYYRNISLLYLKIIYLCFLGKVKSVYINEGGHSKYAIMLANMFPRVSFIIHVRLLEDAAKSRWPIDKKKSNLVLVSVSKTIQNVLEYESHQIYDPYPFDTTFNGSMSILREKIEVGIIGRISITKGVPDILELLEIVTRNGLQKKICFHFFGEVTPELKDSEMLEKLSAFENVVFHGFVSNKADIYNKIDCVLHACRHESLGRVFLESIDYQLPFIGVNNDGIGEIGNILKLEFLLVENCRGKIAHLFLNKIQFLIDNHIMSINRIKEAKALAMSNFNLELYVNKIDSLID